MKLCEISYPSTIAVTTLSTIEAAASIFFLDVGRK
jgi:hypothetical protein